MTSEKKKEKEKEKEKKKSKNEEKTKPKKRKDKRERERGTSSVKCRQISRQIRLRSGQPVWWDLGLVLRFGLSRSVGA